jgi:hypothetical protein
MLQEQQAEEAQIDAMANSLTTTVLDSIRHEQVRHQDVDNVESVVEAAEPESPVDAEEQSLEAQRKSLEEAEVARDLSPTLKAKASTHTLKTQPSLEATRQSHDLNRKSSKDFRKSITKGEEKFTSKSHTLSSIQDLFTDSQKIAYVGLCYLSIADYKKKLEPYKKALQSFEKWAEIFMEKLYVYLDLLPQGYSC